MSFFQWMTRASIVAIATLSTIACQNPNSQADSNTVTSDSSAKQADDSTCRTVQHEMGKSEICGEPERIVVLGPYLLEQMLALGKQPIAYGDHVAFHQGNYDNPTVQIPYMGNRVTTQPVNVGLAYQPSVEAIVKAQPDLILAPNFGQVDYEQLSAIAPTLSFDIMGGNSNLVAIGKAFGLEDRAEELLTKTEVQIEQAKAELAPVVENNPTVLMLSAENMQSLVVMTEANSRCGSLVEELGFQPVYPEGVTGNEVNAIPPISIESLPAIDTADSILLFGYNYDSANMDRFEQSQKNGLKQAWEENAIAQSLEASKTERVYFVPAYLCLGLPGPIGTELYLEELQEQLLQP
ncbi:MAG: iron-siderophore ABC transporter substrate-binding protein [Cyanobacteria bacterium J06649_5]